MKAQTVMQLEPRERGHSAVHKAAQNGKVAGVIYGYDGSSIPVQVPLPVLRMVIGQGGEHHPFMAQLGGQTQLVIIRGLQRDIYTGVPTHFDLMPLKSDDPIAVIVPVRCHGEKELASRGLLMHIELHSLTVHARPSELPESIAVAVGDLKPGTTIRVCDLHLPPGVTVHEKPDLAVVHVGHTRVRQEETVL